MRRSKVMEKIRSGREVRIAVLGHVLPPFVAYAADSGYDCIWLDLEHHPMDQGEVRTLLTFAHLYDIDVVVRPGTLEGLRHGRYLEDGATGIAIPRVSTAAEVREMVERVKFPPLGERGIAARSPNMWARWGLDVAGDHEVLEGHVALVEEALRETFLLLQLETPEGLANLEEMAAVPGFEGFFVGPADLGLRMRYEPEGRRVSFGETLRRLNAACERNGLLWGSFAVDVAELRQVSWTGGAAAVVGGGLGAVAQGSGGQREGDRRGGGGGLRGWRPAPGGRRPGASLLFAGSGLDGARGRVDNVGPGAARRVRVPGAQVDRCMASKRERASISPYHMDRRERAFGGCLGVRCR